VLHRIARLVEPLLRLLYPPEGRHRVEPQPAPVPVPVVTERPFPTCCFADGPCPGARRRALERRRELWRAEYAAELAAHCAATGPAAGFAAELAAGVRR
jgi:hypothetical protein